jgi:carboxyvinyl-carboxyphosphonate phosphorylmutase
MTPSEKRQRLRAILNGSETTSPATVFDALSARVAQAAGYTCGILSGSVSAATVLGAPDMALQTLTEFAQQVRTVTRACDLSVFVDADQGYGNALNVMRTVEELEHAGLAGLAIEDLVMPARFGSQGKDELIAIAEMRGKIRAALAARRDPSLVIVARTAALRVDALDQVVARVREYASFGADAIFLSGLKTLEQLDAVRAVVKLPIIAGGNSGIRRADFAARGVRFHLQGHAVLAAVAKAMHETFMHLRAGDGPAGLEPMLATPDTMAGLLKVADYQRWSETYLE